MDSFILSIRTSSHIINFLLSKINGNNKRNSTHFFNACSILSIKFDKPEYIYWNLITCFLLLLIDTRDYTPADKIYGFLFEFHFYYIFNCLICLHFNRVYFYFRVNLQKYIGPKFAGRNGVIIWPYFNPLELSNLNICWKWCVTIDVSLIREGKN